MWGPCGRDMKDHIARGFIFGFPVFRKSHYNVEGARFRFSGSAKGAWGARFQAWIARVSPKPQAWCKASTGTVTSSPSTLEQMCPVLFGAVAGCNVDFRFSGFRDLSDKFGSKGGLSVH